VFSTLYHSACGAGGGMQTLWNSGYQDGLAGLCWDQSPSMLAFAAALAAPSTWRSGRPVDARGKPVWATLPPGFRMADTRFYRLSNDPVTSNGADNRVEHRAVCFVYEFAGWDCVRLQK
jgi:hypothetical protein